MNTILCEYVNRNIHDAGNKARSDALKIAKDLGYVHIPLFRSGAPKIQVMCQLVAGIVQAVVCTGAGQDLLVQYPYYPSPINWALCKSLALGRRLKHYRMTILVHDLPSLRDGAGSRQGALTTEIRQLAIFDRVICHNDKMKTLLQTSAPTGCYKALGPFDYLYEGQAVAPDETEAPSIVIAGNLNREKSGYIYHLATLQSLQFRLYGVGYKPYPVENLHYQGQFPPEDLIVHLKGSYGLVWDGSSIHTCEGNYGTYLRYNNPHKFSLYLAAGLPVIVWSQSALANYVSEKGIGLTVNSLEELSAKLHETDETSYRLMRQHVLQVRDEIIHGTHLKSALLDW